MAMGMYVGVSGIARKITKIYRGVSNVAREVKAGYRGVSNVARQFYSSSYKITYVVSSSKSYTEEVEPNKTILSPTTFTPTKSGWTFLGWKTNTTANSTVLTSSDANSKATKDMTVYAVFKRTVTTTTSWKCGWCGTVVSGTSKPSSCPNNVCGSKTSGQKWDPKDSTTKTEYYNAGS